MRDLPEVFDIVAGERRAVSEELSVNLEDPENGEILAKSMGSSIEACDEVLERAEDFHREGIFGSLDYRERAAYLEAIGKRLESKVDDIARLDSFSTGVPINQTTGLAKLAPGAFLAAAGHLKKTQDGVLSGVHGPVDVIRRPWGPALCITPWNAPTPLAAHKVASSLAAGCPTILKPSELTPFGPQLLAEGILEADLPVGAFQYLHGDREVAQHLVNSPKVKAISLTGGLAAGQAVGSSCLKGMKPVQLELGGHNPFVVLDDADLDLVAEGVLRGLTTLNGQWCRAIGRIFVQDKIFDRFLAAVGNRLSQVAIGSPFDQETDLGPLVHSRHLNHIRREMNRFRDLGATILEFGSRADNAGHFVVPSLVLDCPLEQDHREIFGPVATVHRFMDDPEVLPHIHSTEYGLAAYVYSRDVSRARHLAMRIEAGSIKINGVSLVGLHPEAPRSAWGISGYGEEGVRETFEFFQGTRTIGLAHS